MMRQVLIAAIGVFVILAAAWVASIVAERRRRALQGRLAAVLAPSPAASSSQTEVASVLRREATGRGARAFPLVPPRFRQWLVAELQATGDSLGITSLLIAAAVGTLITTGVLTGIVGFDAEVTVPAGLAAGICMVFLRLRMAQRRFQRRFVEVFPDALDVIVRAARAGLPVLDAMEAAVGTVAQPVSGEFRKILDQMRIGVDLEEVLENAADRIRVNDFRFFSAAIVLQRRTGGSLAETLSNLSGLIRKRKEIRLKVRALSAETRATAYLLGVLPILMIGVAYALNPDLMSLLFTDRRGKIVLAIAIAMEVFGFLLMNAMVKRALR